MQSYRNAEDCRYAIFQDQNGPYLAHYQVKGAKHGVRRYQNEDGSLTPLGREHYGVGPPRDEKKLNTIEMNGKNVNAKLDGNTVGRAKNAAATLRTRLNQMAEQRKANSAAKAIVKEAKRQDKEASKEAKAAMKAAKKESDDKERAEKEEAARVAAEEAEAKAEQARVDALKRYYRDHPLQIYSARDLLSQEDIKDVESQIRLDRELKDFRREEYMRYAKTLKDVAGVLDDTYKTAKSLKDIYNVGAETYNALIAAKDPNDDKKPLRLIGNDKMKLKKPSDASTDKNSEQNQGQEQGQNQGQGKKKQKQNQNGQTEGNQAPEKKAQGTMDSLKKEMVNKEKSASSNAKSEQAKKNFENLAKNVNSKKSDKAQSESNFKPAFKEKVTTKRGSVRYFYDQDEYDAYQDAKKNLVGKTMRAYTTASFDERLNWSQKLDDIVDSSIRKQTWSSKDNGKYRAIMDAVSDYYYVMGTNDPDNPNYKKK